MIYLDNAATTKPFKASIDAVQKYMNFYYNPSAAYSLAIEAEKYLEQARRTIAQQLNALPSEVYFTSGGTECNNLAVMGTLLSKRGGSTWHFITSEVEHAAIYDQFVRLEEMGQEVTCLPVESDGSVNPHTLMGAIRPNTALVSIMHVNNELGSINDINMLARAVKSMNPRVLFHSDGVQAFGKTAPPGDDVDLYSTSAHKMHGPKGVGALVVRNGVNLQPLNIGGGQEGGLRSGTENLGGIMGFAAAVEEYMADNARIAHMYACKKHLAHELLKIEGAQINGPSVEKGAPHVLSVSFSGAIAEMLLHMLEEKQIYVGTGSACSSKKRKINRILQAIRLDRPRAEGTIRFSLCAENTIEQMQIAAQHVGVCVDRIKKLRRK
jgi:cysteine desulfurase